MQSITLDQFLANSKEIIIKAAIGEESSRISVPGAAAAVIISEQEYESLTAGKEEYLCE